MEMMAVWAAVLIVYGVFPGTAAQPGAVAGASAKSAQTDGASADNPLPLDMAVNSVDDMYSGCKDQMSNVVNNYLMNEKNTNSNFKSAWDQGENYYNKKRKNSKMLTKEQIVAIYAYTSASGDIYKDLNAAVRSQGPQYKTSFGYHAFHFYLTTAVQALNAQEQPPGYKCTPVKGYRRVDRYYSQNVLNRKIRFGSFTSSSRGQYSKPELFGDKSCFEINTCLGADVSFFSKFGDAEGEVLIPPYEVFKVTAIEKRSDNKNLPCEVVYKLTGSKMALPNFNCALFSSSMKHFN